MSTANNVISKFGVIMVEQSVGKARSQHIGIFDQYKHKSHVQLQFLTEIKKLIFTLEKADLYKSRYNLSAA